MSVSTPRHRASRRRRPPGIDRPVALDPPPAADPRLGAAQAFLRSVGSLPLVRVDQRGAHATIHCTAPDASIATLDVDTGALTVFVSAEMVRPMVATSPLVRVTRGRVRLYLFDAGGRTAGERLIRQRIELERFAPQWRDASP